MRAVLKQWELVRLLMERTRKHWGLSFKGSIMRGQKQEEEPGHEEPQL